MSDIVMIVTAAGRAKLPSNTGGTSAVTITHFGISETAVVPNPLLTALPAELKRITTIAGGAVSPNMITVTVTDFSTDVYDMRSFGLYLSDGTLFAVYGQPLPVVEKAGAATMHITMDIAFVDVDAEEIEFGDTNFLLPPATETVQGVVELATNAETQTGTDGTRAVTPKGLLFAFTAWLNAQLLGVWRSTNDGAGSGLDADLLDGLHASAFLRVGTAQDQSISIRNDYPRLYFRDTDAAGVMMGVQGGDLYLFKTPADSAVFENLPNGYQLMRIRVSDGQVNFGGDLFRTSFRLWDAGNDGAGSGLDADLLDGLHGADFLRNSATAQVNDIYIRKAVPRLYLRDTGAFGSVQRMQAGVLTILKTAADATAEELLPNGQAPLTLSMISGAMNVGGPITRAGNTVWDAANDGAGSGLDADLLDGQQGSYYTAIAARLGYTPANRAGDTFTGAVTMPTLTVTGTAITRAGQTVWDAGNDGAGSGLDADLLDGQQGSYYTAITARLGYTPANKAGDTLTGPLIAPAFESVSFKAGGSAQVVPFATNTISLRGLSDATQGYLTFGNADAKALGRNGAGALTFDSQQLWHAGNDGAGSGLDADLLDGQHGSYYTAITARLGYTPVQQGGGAGQNPNKVYIGWSGSRLKAQVDAADQGNIVFDSHINDVWRASNDGAGSGLDADMLDGIQAADFALLSLFADRDLTAAKGHYSLPGGLVINWGTSGVLSNDAEQTIVLSKPYTKLLAAVSVGNLTNRFHDNWGNILNPPINAACNSITVVRGYQAGGGGNGTVTFIALGIA